MEKETLEEAYLNKLIDKANKEFTLDRKLAKEVAIKFAKWQQEQDKNKYSEEEVLNLIKKGLYTHYNSLTTEEWFNKNKKK
jgi:hypothetical protein